MSRSILPKTLMFLTTILFLASLIFLTYNNFFDSKYSRSRVEKSNSKSENFAILKQSGSVTDILNIESIDRNAGLIEVSSSTKEISVTDSYKFDDDTLLICLEDRKSLETFIDFSNTDLYSGFLESDNEFLDTLIGRFVKLKVRSGYIAAVIVGGCD